MRVGCHTSILSSKGRFARVGVKRCAVGVAEDSNKLDAVSCCFRGAPIKRELHAGIGYATHVYTYIGMKVGRTDSDLRLRDLGWLWRRLRFLGRSFWLSRVLWFRVLGVEGDVRLSDPSGNHIIR
jgi:hypothetical protein